MISSGQASHQTAMPPVDGPSVAICRQDVSVSEPCGLVMDEKISGRENK